MRLAVRLLSALSTTGGTQRAQNLLSFWNHINGNGRERKGQGTFVYKLIFIIFKVRSFPGPAKEKERLRVGSSVCPRVFRALALKTHNNAMFFLPPFQQRETTATTKNGINFRSSRLFAGHMKVHGASTPQGLNVSLAQLHFAEV